MQVADFLDYYPRSQAEGLGTLFVVKILFSGKGVGLHRTKPALAPSTPGSQPPLLRVNVGFPQCSGYSPTSLNQFYLISEPIHLL